MKEVEEVVQEVLPGVIQEFPSEVPLEEEGAELARAAGSASAFAASSVSAAAAGFPDVYAHGVCARARTPATSDGSKRKSVGNAKGKGKRRYHGPYSKELRLKAVLLHLEEGIPVAQIAIETGVSDCSFYEWLKLYRDGGAEALDFKRNPPFRQGGGRGLPVPVREKVVELKRENPEHGVRRISQILRRWLFLPVSHETVRKTLHEEKLLDPSPPKPKAPPTAPRFFERSTPNQMWQSDIFTFRINNRNVYLIGFIDDHSRYIVALELFHSQTAENVLEVYRRAVAAHGPPKEMLTDNGRQYTSWRGKTRFEKELAKERVHHLRSQPHHPMTLGKIERFWKTIWTDFLHRARFETFESARERIAYWVGYYNHKRPHQGIDGLCPADRFFKLREDVRAVVEKGVKDNAHELATRGEPKKPFYMVGRLGGQSVVMRQDGGRVAVTVSDEGDAGKERVVCDLEKGSMEHERAGEEKENGAAAVHGGGEMQGGAGAVDGAAVGVGPVPGAGRDVERAVRVAGAGDGRDAAGAGAEADGSCWPVDAEPAAALPAGAEDGEAGSGPGGGAPPDAAGEVGSLETPPPDPAEAAAGSAEGGSPQGEGSGGRDGGGGIPLSAPADLPPWLLDAMIKALAERSGGKYVMTPSSGASTASADGSSMTAGRCHDGESGWKRPGGDAGAQDRGGSGGHREAQNGGPGGGGSGRLAQDLLRVAEQSHGGVVGLDAGRPSGPTAEAAGGSGDTPAQGGERRLAAGEPGAEGGLADQGGSGRGSPPRQGCDGSGLPRQ